MNSYHSAAYRLSVSPCRCSSAVALYLETAVIEEIHNRTAASDTARFLTDEENTFHILETLKHFETYPDSVLVIGTDACLTHRLRLSYPITISSATI